MVSGFGIMIVVNIFILPSTILLINKNQKLQIVLINALEGRRVPCNPYLLYSFGAIESAWINGWSVIVTFFSEGLLLK